MPALAHNRSTLLHSLVARSPITLTCSKLETSAPSAIASPPALRISSTTASAGVSEPPVRARGPPEAPSTTLAPRLASPSACARPRPLPGTLTAVALLRQQQGVLADPGCGAVVMPGPD